MRVIVTTVALLFACAFALEAQAVRSGFETNAMSPTLCGAGCTLGTSANDDGSQGPLALGFTLDFFGTSYDNVYLNTNGNLTLTEGLLNFTPFEITGGTKPMFAPFFADVDTNDGNLVRYGADLVGGRTAWGATWDQVCFYAADCSLTNTFQVLLIDRSDVGAGDFDIEFNYDQVQWETGDASGGTDGLGGESARVGWTNGAGDFFELAGSGVNGAFLDGNLASGLVYNRLSSDQDGRYVFNVRNGTVVGVPEPGTLLLMVGGLVVLMLLRRTRRDVTA